MKTPAKLIDSGDNVQQGKKMLLELPLEIHAWVKEIAETTGTPQPKVVTMVLQQASVTAARHYIDQIETVKAEQRAAEIDAKLSELQAERKQLQSKLN